MTGSTPTRVAVGALGAINLITGTWALVAPRHWFEHYPGFGHHWVVEQGGAANAHLAADTGAGFLAVGVALALACIWWRRTVVQLPLVVLIAHTVPHFLHHVTHPPARSMSLLDEVVGIWGIAAEAAVGTSMLVAVMRGRAIVPD
ncbi:MAG: hypothetical protein QOI95_4394 [Acidimicrobiaceae bacterium]